MNDNDPWRSLITVSLMVIGIIVIAGAFGAGDNHAIGGPTPPSLLWEVLWAFVGLVLVGLGAFFRVLFPKRARPLIRARDARRGIYPRPWG